ncbi:hypothetical protein [Burkholderia lata]|uniref:hypothetical protein n=1 Tax=Burkholderia lata (strain ATCC 17760 / DSM 23089 / LMG 22485 / NCIMB 9086 / R18194 / 383) TaxID=482957 RepID=UPI00158220D2|nr:hypothetical protein [Burkholderia lata]
MPIYKQMVSLRSEVEALRKRVELLEQSGASAPKRDECPKCHGLTFGLDRTAPDPTFGDMGVERDYYRCQSCGYERSAQRG